VNLVLSRAAEKDLERLDPHTLSAVLAIVRRLRRGDGTVPLKKIEGASQMWRIRVGSWRIIISPGHHADAGTIVRILHRREVYLRVFEPTPEQKPATQPVSYLPVR